MSKEYKTVEQVAAEYDEFERKWLGGRDDFDHVFGYQCVDLTKRYIYTYYGIPNGAYGNAIDWWTKTAKIILERFARVADTTVRKGDIVVLTGLGSNKYGHIMIANGQQSGDTFTGLEQNGSTGNGKGEGGDAIRLRQVAKSRIAGILRPITSKAPAGAGKRVHTVVKGDTLTRIGRAYGVNWQIIFNANRGTIGSDPNKIYPGQKLTIP